MKRPTRPIDPADAPEYEADLDAYHKAQDDAGDRYMEEDVVANLDAAGYSDSNNETENDNDNE